MIKEYETTVSKIIYYDEKKNEFLEDFREISLVGSLNDYIKYVAIYFKTRDSERNVIEIKHSSSQSVLPVFNSPSIIVETVYTDLLSPRKGNKSWPTYNTK